MKKKEFYSLGVLSGTSLDGLDLSLIRSDGEKKIKILGPFPADTLFIKKNLKKFDVIVGMYHDQVLTPIKTLYEFNAINITVGIPFLRISPDHGVGKDIVKKNKASPKSLLESIKFFKKIDAKT